MDNGLVLASAKILTLEKSGLNPFCNGQWSRTNFSNFKSNSQSSVLILFVMDNGLVPDKKNIGSKGTKKS